MTNFMSSNNDATETASILNDGNTIDFFQALIYHTRSTNVSKSFNFTRENGETILYS